MHLADNQSTHSLRSMLNQNYQADTIEIQEFSEPDQKIMLTNESTLFQDQSYLHFGSS